MNKKSLIILLSVSVFVLGFVSAQNYGSFSQEIINFYIEFFQPILQALFGGFGWSGLYLFERLLLFLIVVSLVFLSLSRVPAFDDQKAVKWVITISVSLLSIRYINYEWLNGILIQYQVLAIVLTSILPLILFFFFVSNILAEYPLLRKIFWLFFIGIYVGLWNNSSIVSQKDIFFWTMVTSILIMFFDNKINQYLEISRLKKSSNPARYNFIANLDSEIRQINASSLPNKEKMKLIKEKEQQKKFWYKQIA